MEQNIEMMALTAPGLVGRLTRWILENAIKPQPSLALAGALAIISTLKGQRVQSPTGLRTNLFICGVGDSGTGKNHPLECARAVFHQLELEAYICGEPASGTALVNAVESNWGRRLVVWDEIGHTIKAITSSHAKNFETEISTVMMKMFSSASTFYSGKELASAAANAKQINHPNLCVLGMTTPGRFYESFTSANCADGFMPRWLIFEVTNPDAEERKKRSMHLPPDLKEELRALTNWGRMDGNLSFTNVGAWTITLSEEADTLLDGAKKTFSDLMRHYRGSGLDAIYARAKEHAIKIALTAAQGKEITKAEMAWAIGIADYSCSILVEAIEKLAGNSDNERNAKKLQQVIKREKQITRTDLFRTTRGFGDVRVFDRAISVLQQSGLIEMQSKKEQNSRKASTWYIWVG